MRVKVPAIVVAVLFVAAAAYAHHSFAGTYIEGKLVKLEGDVVEFNIRNPHSFIVIEVTEKDGKKVKWGGEWGGVTQLSQGGVTRFTLEVGVRVRKPKVQLGGLTRRLKLIGVPLETVFS